MDEQWRWWFRTLASLHFAEPDPLLSSWMSSPACRLQDFPVQVDLASGRITGPSLTQAPSKSTGGSVPANQAPTTASK